MADARFCVGFSSACKQAREGGGLPGYKGRVSRGRALRPFLPPDIVRLIDALVRRLEHEDTLLSMNGGDLGRTLSEAATAGGLLDVRFLLARGADLEVQTVFLNEEGDEVTFSALEWSAHAGHLLVVTALLDAGAVECDRAMHAASFYGHTPVVALLLDRGADVRFREGISLVSASEHGHLVTAALLLDRGANVNAQNDRPLLLAAQNGHLEMVRLLLDRRADAQAEESRAFRVAADTGHLEVVRLLLDRGANVHARNETALRWARENGHSSVAALLLERGALEPEEE